MILRLAYNSHFCNYYCEVPRYITLISKGNQVIRMAKIDKLKIRGQQSIKLNCDADIAIKFSCSKAQLNQQIDFNLMQIIHEFNRLILTDDQAKSIYFEEL